MEETTNETIPPEDNSPEDNSPEDNSPEDNFQKYKLDQNLKMTTLQSCNDFDKKDYVCLGFEEDLMPCINRQIQKFKVDRNVQSYLSYCEVKAMYEKSLISKENLEPLLEKNEIGLFKPGTPPSKEDYSINLLWIHKENFLFKHTLKEQEEFHYFGEDSSKFTKYIYNPIADWQSKIPEAQINFWYDGHQIPDKTLENTKHFLKSSGINLDHVSFKDLRETFRFKIYPDFLSENLPIYYRVDLSKYIIADELMSQYGSSYYVVFTDIDVAAMVKEQLFDSTTLKRIEKFGMVAGGHFTTENYFMIYKNIQKDFKEEKDFKSFHLSYLIRKIMNEASFCSECTIKDSDDYKALTSRAFSTYNQMLDLLRKRDEDRLGPFKRVFASLPVNNAGINGFSENIMKSIRKHLCPSSNDVIYF